VERDAEANPTGIPEIAGRGPAREPLPQHRDMHSRAVGPDGPKVRDAPARKRLHFDVHPVLLHEDRLRFRAHRSFAARALRLPELAIQFTSIARVRTGGAPRRRGHAETLLEGARECARRAEAMVERDLE